MDQSRLATMEYPPNAGILTKEETTQTGNQGCLDEKVPSKSDDLNETNVSNLKKKNDVKYGSLFKTIRQPNFSVLADIRVTTKK